VNEVERIIDTPIYMRFCREIDHRVELVLGHQGVHQVRISNIGFEKFVTLAMFFDHAFKVRDVTSVSEYIDISDECRLVMLQNISNKVAPDESAATGDKDAHGSAY
jgi:hypothetical protein